MNRSKRYVFATAVALPMFYLAGCRPGGGLTVPFEFPLTASIGTFDVVAGESTQNAGPGTLRGKSRDVGSATLSLDPDAITFTPSDDSGSKGLTTYQTGSTFTVTAGIGGADDLDTVCATPVDEYGPFTVTLDADFNVLRDYIARFQQGTWPDPNLFINTTPSPAETDKEFACGD